ncbi:MAG: hypothetical protein LBD34_02335 [Puniceicoccales bacterium]|nr:hypothetical protein [Puniceicoccales bacterium]
MSTAVVVGGDRVPILQSTEHIFNFVAPLMQIYVVEQLDSTVVERRNARLHPALFQSISKPVTPITHSKS